MNGIRDFIAYMGALGQLTFATFIAFLRPPWDIRSVIYQLDTSGIGSWSITALTAIFTGMVLALQFSSGLETYGASMYTGKLVSLGIVRELGPVLTALLVGGRVGSGFAAELGSMVVTEQVDAIRALGADPIKKLVVPRIVACMIALPLLTMMADLVGCFGGMIITVQEVEITPRFFYSQILDTLGIVDLLHGLGKSLFFGYIIGITGCFVGLHTTGGTEGVGLSTTKAVVASAVGVLISDFMLTKLFIAIYG